LRAGRATRAAFEFPPLTDLNVKQPAFATLRRGKPSAQAKAPVFFTGAGYADRMSGLPDIWHSKTFLAPRGGAFVSPLANMRGEWSAEWRNH
jgi:hypothetical protein